MTSEGTKQRVEKLIWSIDHEITNLKMNLLENYTKAVTEGDEVRIKELERTKDVLKAVFLIR